MRQTLFHIPHQLGPLPLFGLGWMLLIWAVVAVIILVRAARTAGRKGVLEQIPFVVIVAVIIALVLPNIEETPTKGKPPIGLPIRGYGVMLLLGVVSGMGTAAYRARKLQLDEGFLFSLAFWMFISGIIGARLFYLVQYWDTFAKPDFRDTLISIVNFTEGGLVVYGSVIGGLFAGFLYLRAKELPVLPVADLIAPSMVLGLAIGRIGCLLNGCCHGGVCEKDLPAIRFPVGSPPYMQQLHDGDLLGMELRLSNEQSRDKKVIVERVKPDSPADEKGVEPGAIVKSMPTPKKLQQYRQEGTTKRIVEIINETGRAIGWTLRELPERSLPVHPAQIYASINAFLLFLVTWFLFPLRRRDGVTFATLMTLYPISRILEELIRSDEAGQLGTALTISQWISIGVLVFVSGLWIYIARRGKSATTSFAHFFDGAAD